MTIKRFIDFPFLSVYRSIGFALFLFAGFAGGAPKQPGIPNQDSMKVYNMSARLDSLTLEVRKAELHNEFIAKNTESILRENTFVRNAFWAFIVGQVGILAIITAGLSFFIYRRTETEREHVVEQVQKLITPDFDKNLSDNYNFIKMVDGDLKDLHRNYQQFAIEREKKSREDDANHISFANRIEKSSEVVKDLMNALDFDSRKALNRNCEIFIGLIDISLAQNNIFQAIKFVGMCLKEIEIRKNMESTHHNFLYGILMVSVDSFVFSKDFTVKNFGQLAVILGYMKPEDYNKYVTMGNDKYGS